MLVYIRYIGGDCYEFEYNYCTPSEIENLNFFLQNGLVKSNVPTRRQLHRVAYTYLYFSWLRKSMKTVNTYIETKQKIHSTWIIRLLVIR